MDWESPKISRMIDEWIEEDLGKGDLTNSAITQEKGCAFWLAKEDGIFCGVEIIKRIFDKIDKNINCKLNIKDGESFSANQTLLKLNGPTKSLLASERISLNIAMHLSGISTHAKRIVEKIKGL